MSVRPYSKYDMALEGPAGIFDCTTTGSCFIFFSLILCSSTPSTNGLEQYWAGSDDTRTPVVTCPPIPQHSGCHITMVTGTTGFAATQIDVNTNRF